MEEYKNEETLLVDINSSLESLIDTLTAGFEGLFEALDENLISATNKISDSKVEKGTNNFKGMLKKIGLASPMAFVLEQVVGLLEPFLMLLDPFIVLFEILGSLFEIFASEIMVVLFDALDPVFDLLIALTPLFKLLGQVIGVLLEIGLIPFKIVVELITALLKPFLALFDNVGTVMEFIGKILIKLIQFALLPFVLAVYGIGLAIAAVIDFISAALNLLDIFDLFDKTHLVKDWNELMLPIIENMVSLEGFAEGAMITTPTLSAISEKGETEGIFPLSKAKQMGFGGENETHLVDMNDKLDELIMLERKKNRTLQRRRFG
ncbi:MAG: hypothetical protein OEL89_00015 [Candidatus Peregrinibacteria bacterium]|nr:hypothetical protein [Candidatus Peregrinibacteria bacterium]